MDKTIEPDLMTQSQFARRWGLSRQYISRLCLRGVIPMFASRIDVEAADEFIKRNAIGLQRIPFTFKERNQYIKRLEKRKELT